MYRIRQIGKIAGYNFRYWKREPRIFMTFALAFTMCFLLSDKALDFSQSYQKSMQAVEPFIWTFGDASSVMVISTMLLLLFADLPILNSGVPYYLMRTTRKRWLFGQVTYIILAEGIYLVFVLLSTVAVCARNSFPGNLWSATGATLGYSELGKDLQLPVSVKVMEHVTPYECMLQIFTLMFCYCICMVLFMLILNLKWGKRAGIIGGVIYSLYGMLLNPDVIVAILKISDEKKFQANIILGWISPLNHATYSMHNFGYDLLPTLAQSYLIFSILIALMTVTAALLMRKYSFNFTGERA